jgi:exodeoxyribonuclease V alpha subunit
MLGFAQSQFLQIDGQSLLRHQMKDLFPLITSLLQSDTFSYIDWALAQKMTKGLSNIQEAELLFLCYLSFISRRGHLCIQIEDAKILPDPQDLWQEAYNEQIHQCILTGSRTLPQGLVQRDGTRFYFDRQWVYESQFLAHFIEIKQSIPSLSFDLHKIQEELQSLLQKQKLLPEQADAILKGCQNSLTLICGGPGTGKTYTAGYLVKLFWNALTDQQKASCEIALAAPTGKAAANLQKSLGKVLNDLSGLKPITAVTLHGLLGISRKAYQSQDITYLLADLIIVDESSMIDVQMMVKLLSSVKPGARLIFLGDKHQLPPVEAGGLFADMIACLESEDQTSVAFLKTCLRAELEGIVHFAQWVNEGNYATLSASHPAPGIVIDSRDVNSLLEYASPFFDYPGFSETEEIHVLTLFNRFRILSPMRKGPQGVEELNSRLRLAQTKKYRHRSKFMAPIMITHNDKRLELFNGEVGILVRNHHGQNEQLQEGDYALFPSNVDGSVRRFPAILLPRYEYAYCLSVHKSQGSEFDEVLLWLPEGSEVFGREVLYTGITRAKKKLVLACEQETLRKVMERRSLRLSGVCERYKSLVEIV